MARTIFGKNPHYQFRDQDPVIDEMRYLLRASKLKLSKVAENTGLSVSTLYNWFVTKRTISPRHDSVKIFFGSFGVRYGQLNSTFMKGPRRPRTLRLVSSRKVA
jgi:hypothetical protein